MKRTHEFPTAVLVLLALVACEPSARDDGPAIAASENAPSAASLGENSPQGKPTAPIDIEYNVIGSALVGQPVNIEIDVSSTVRDRPIALDYRINDPRALSFAESQPERVSVSAIGDAPSASRQVTVVPKRAGRLYLNVSATIETEEGALIKAISIPVQVVGGSRNEREVNGELKEDADGETVVSMPAEEN